MQCNRWGLVLQLLAGLSVVPGLFDSTKAKSFFEALARSLREVTIEAWLRRDSHMPSRVELFLMLSWFLAFLDFGWYLWDQSISEVWAKCMILMCALAFAAFVPYGLATITEGIARILGWLSRTLMELYPYPRPGDVSSIYDRRYTPIGSNVCKIV